MSKLAAPYDFLDTLPKPVPRMVVEALALLGTVETPGKADNPVIMGWRNEVGDPSVLRDYTHDSVAWCGLFMAVVAKRAGKTPVSHPLWALNWGKFGEDGGQPMLGDVLTFIRPEGGHVALYIGESRTSYHVLGGNQSDKVCFTQIAKERLRKVRRPLYMSRPACVRPYLLGEGGSFSTNER